MWGLADQVVWCGGHVMLVILVRWCVGFSGGMECELCWCVVGTVLSCWCVRGCHAGQVVGCRV